MNRKLKEAGIGLLFGIPALILAASVRTEIMGPEGMILGITLLTALLFGGYFCLSRLRDKDDD